MSCLVTIQASLARERPVTVERWFNAPNDELIPEDWGGAGEEPVSPRDWLLSGLPPRRVALVARYLGETP
jgi:hypothetical protein